MKVLTYTVKNNDCSIDRITYDCKHAGNKCITDGYSGNSIECKYNQNIMQKRQYRTACKTDVFKSEPDIKKHTDECVKIVEETIFENNLIEDTGVQWI